MFGTFHPLVRLAPLGETQVGPNLFLRRFQTLSLPPCIGTEKLNEVGTRKRQSYYEHP